LLSSVWFGTIFFVFLAEEGRNDGWWLAFLFSARYAGNAIKLKPLSLKVWWLWAARPVNQACADGTRASCHPDRAALIVPGFVRQKRATL
jgi:hypothetical protein